MGLSLEGEVVNGRDILSKTMYKRMLAGLISVGRKPVADLAF